MEPHGKVLINRIPNQTERANWLEYALFLRKIVVDSITAADLELIATGAYSPLTGFLSHDDYRTVLRDVHLANGTPWSIPITLALPDEMKDFATGQDVTLRNSAGEDIAVLRIEEIYPADKKLEAQSLYRTLDLSHPGTVWLQNRGNYLAAGPIIYLGGRSRSTPFFDYYLTPHETRTSFRELGWERITAFETRHQNSEILSKILQASSESDGLLIQPVTGISGNYDLPADVKLRCYEILLQTYFPPHRSFLAALPVEWRFAGAREAVHHAIIRKNYGATHVVIDPELYGEQKEVEEMWNAIGRDQLAIKPVFLQISNQVLAC